jgi:hypothetical protein
LNHRNPQDFNEGVIAFEKDLLTTVGTAVGAKSSLQLISSQPHQATNQPLKSKGVLCTFLPIFGRGNYFATAEQPGDDRNPSIKKASVN